VGASGLFGVCTAPLRRGEVPQPDTQRDRQSGERLRRVWWQAAAALEPPPEAVAEAILGVGAQIVVVAGGQRRDQLLLSEPDAHPAEARPGAHNQPVVEALAIQFELLHARAGGQALRGVVGTEVAARFDDDAALPDAAHDLPRLAPVARHDPLHRLLRLAVLATAGWNGPPLGVPRHRRQPCGSGASGGQGRG